jgi:hypothetical protein
MTEEVQRLLALVGGTYAGGDPFATPEFRAMFALARAGQREDLDGLLTELSPGIEVTDPFYAACVALCCGTLVEYGGSPAVAGEAIAARLFRELDGEVAPQAGQFLCLSAMAHLCRDRALRQRVRARFGVPESLERAEEHVRHTWFVRTVLELTDDLELLVLAPEVRRGYRVRADAVASCFHLFTLLQGALIGDPAQGWLDAEPEDPEILAIATGEARHVRPATASQRFHFHNWSALAPDGRLRDDLGSSIWGESSPAEIPHHEGSAVVLVGPPVLGGRAWDTNFFANIHDALRSSVTVLEQLSESRVTALLTSMAARSAALGPADE